MNHARLPAHLEASGLLRRAEAAGGFATILTRGDRERGVMVVILAERGTHFACLERGLAATGAYLWQKVGPESEATAVEVSGWCAQRRKFDRDLWLIELDVPQPERFIAETIAIG